VTISSLISRKGRWFVVGATLVVALAIVGATRLVPGVSALLVAIIVGAVVRNLRLLPVLADREISWSSKKLLRLGIVLLGFKLSLFSLLEIGPSGIAILVSTVVVTFVGTLMIGQLLGTSRSMRMLVATGFSICGASAVAAMSSIVDPEGEAEEDVAHAVALVTIFGTITMLTLPALVPLLGLSHVQAGLWIGASVHEVAQVVAAGGLVSVAALTIATVAKLGRVVLLAPLIATVGALQHRGHGDAGKRPPLLPLFVAGFLAAVLLRSFLPLDVRLLDALDFTATLLLAAAMLGLGFGVDGRKLIATGWKPMLLGTCSTLIAALTALLGVVTLA